VKGGEKRSAISIAIHEQRGYIRRTLNTFIKKLSAHVTISAEENCTVESFSPKFNNPLEM